MIAICRLILMTVTLWLLAATAARADNCVATMTDVDFGVVSPIAGSDVTASGTLTVTCYWTVGTNPLLLPAANVCVNLGVGPGGGTGAPRYLLNGSNRMAFNLYTDSSYTAAKIWGSTASTIGARPINGTLVGLLGLGGVTQSFTVYGKIPAASLVGVATVGNADTLYGASFAGHGTVQYGFGSVPCTGGASAAFSFQARATAVNNCLISTSNLAFASGSPITDQRISAPLSVACTANSTYQIALNGGVSNNPGARTMKNSVTGETLGYRISSTPDGAAWGDGTASTTVYSGTGTGSAQNVMMYGIVPRQRAPTPGDYRDTVTVLLMF
ncbi:spore coat protein U-like protein [Massilia aurea]|jgi:spore coat protein U-like protein|uniref:Spore coat protein U-like protein n=1 Tax=Massilia aurea TaxID=373040 RepID=A0A7W9X4M8_9BURK|nr:spore coat U domain-containing protein [Massilia aurea]MBB6136129.1 spore coat protein U-like protein [Massilia aurea]